LRLLNILKSLLISSLGSINLCVFIPVTSLPVSTPIFVASAKFKSGKSNSIVGDRGDFS
jgi:hypothetical protein